VRPELRLIVTSATYRQSSATTAELAQRDPENRWLGHGPRFRLDAEAIRDSVLAVSGISSVIGAVLNAHERFVATALAPLAVPLGTLAGLVLLQNSYGIEATGTLAGFTGECFILVLAAARETAAIADVARIRSATCDVGRRYRAIVLGTLMLEPRRRRRPIHGSQPRQRQRLGAQLRRQAGGAGVVDRGCELGQPCCCCDFRD
jgi:hypothetical protein